MQSFQCVWFPNNSTHQKLSTTEELPFILIDIALKKKYKIPCNAQDLSLLCRILKVIWLLPEGDTRMSLSCWAAMSGGGHWGLKGYWSMERVLWESIGFGAGENCRVRGRQHHFISCETLDTEIFQSLGFFIVKWWELAVFRHSGWRFCSVIIVWILRKIGQRKH